MSNPDIILYQHDIFKPLLDMAMNITLDYIRENKLMLTGGMSIDLALREKNKSIYEDEQLADYDILSDKNLYHSYELAKRLCNAGLPDINVINAVHITTVRVRIKRSVLLDATFVPESIFPKIPSLLTSDGLYIVHPHYQLIDQRSSLSMLLADKGMDLNIFLRLQKDIERNELLRESYPIEKNDYKITYTSLSIPLEYIVVDDAYINQLNPDVFVYTGTSCITGYLAYHLYMNMDDPKKYPIIIKDGNLIIDIPSTMKISLLAYDVDKLKKLLHNPSTYRRLLSIKPASIADDRYEINDSYGLRIGCNMLKLPNGDTVCIAGTNELLMGFLRDRIYKHEEPYTTLYHSLIYKVLKKANESFDKDDIWFLALSCYGLDNLPEYKIYDLEKRLNPELSNILTPRNEYLRNPTCEVRDNIFDPLISHYFQIDGAKDDSIEHTNYKYITEAFAEFLKNKRSEPMEEVA